MNVEEQLAAGRARRRRAQRLQAVASAAGPVLMIAILIVLDGTPLLGVAFFAVAVVMVGAYVFPHRDDEWERRHALRVAAVGFAAMVAWQVGEVAWWLVQEGYRPSPGRALVAGAGGIMIANVVLRQLAERPKAE